MTPKDQEMSVIIKVGIYSQFLRGGIPYTTEIPMGKYQCRLEAEGNLGLSLCCGNWEKKWVREGTQT